MYLPIVLKLSIVKDYFFFPTLSRTIKLIIRKMNVKIQKNKPKFLLDLIDIKLLHDIAIKISSLDSQFLYLSCHRPV